MLISIFFSSLLHKKWINSFISGITFVGLPNEIYSFGIQYLYISGGVLLMGFFMSAFYLPVFHDMNITSTYEVRNCDAIQFVLGIKLKTTNSTWFP